MYKVIFDGKVIEFMEKLDYNTKFKIIDSLKIIRENPFEIVKKLYDTYALKINGFKVILDINVKEKLIKVLFIRKI